MSYNLLHHHSPTAKWRITYTHIGKDLARRKALLIGLVATDCGLLGFGGFSEKGCAVLGDVGDYLFTLEGVGEDFACS